MSFIRLQGIGAADLLDLATKTTSSADLVDINRPPTPDRPCDGEWRWMSGATPPRWSCYLPAAQPAPPGWEWQGAQQPRRWACRTKEACAELKPGDNLELQYRYYDTEGLPSGMRGGWRWTPPGRTGPAGAGPKWYVVNTRPSQTPSTPSDDSRVREKRSAVLEAECRAAGVPEALIPRCVELRSGPGYPSIEEVLQMMAADIAAAQASQASSSRSRLYLYGGLAAAGVLGILLLKRKR